MRTLNFGRICENKKNKQRKSEGYRKMNIGRLRAML